MILGISILALRVGVKNKSGGKSQINFGVEKCSHIRYN